MKAIKKKKFLQQMELKNCFQVEKENCNSKIQSCFAEQFDKAFPDAMPKL
jgi:hypothetical protein